MPTPAGRNLKRQWLAWLTEYSGPGYYGRKTNSPLARSVYVRLHSVSMLAWLAHGLGVPASVVRRAVREAEHFDAAPAQGRAFRKTVAWVEIETLLRLSMSPTIATPRDLRRCVMRLSHLSPETDRFTRRWTREPAQQERAEVWYSHQKEHWLGWLREYDGPGAYGRVVRRRSAEYVFNHVVNPQMLVWLAEAVGVPRSTIRTGVDAALAERSMPAMSRAIRRVIGWSQIAWRLT